MNRAQRAQWMDVNQNRERKEETRSTIKEESKKIEKKEHYNFKWSRSRRLKIGRVLASCKFFGRLVHNIMARG